MRISPTKLLHGLLYTAPVLLLTLAACGGGGSPPPTTQLTTTFDVGGIVSGLVSGDTLVLRNNGGDDKTITADGAYVFTVSSGGNYNVTVLTHPLSPTVKKCTITGTSSGSNLSADISNLNVACNPAFTIGGDFTGSPNSHGSGLVLQNNGENLLIPVSDSSFVFSIPIESGVSSTVSVLTNPHNPPQTCVVATNVSNPVIADVSNVAVNCTNSVVLSTDRYVYTANFGSDNISRNDSANGVLSGHATVASGSQPYAIAVNPTGSHAYVVNFSGDTVSAYSIASGALIALDMDAVTGGTQNTVAAGNGPRAISIHPSGNYAYVANYLDNSVSAYSITTGVLARIDSDGVTANTQYSIPAKVGPTSIAIHPLGGYAYVANTGASGSAGSISVYSINTTTGALTAIDADGTGSSTDTFIPAGQTTSSVAIDPDGQYLYATNTTSNTISVYSVNTADGSLTLLSSPEAASGPSFITIYPGGGYAYVANSAGNILIYTIASGALTPHGTTPFVAAGSLPLSISIDSTGQHAYVANSGSTGTGGVSAYSINIANGVLTAVGGSPFTSGSNPFAVTTSR